MSAPAPRRVLFVDDDVTLLGGLRRVLRRSRRAWETAFAPGGEAGIACLAAEPYDVVVCDMRMPAVDGVAVLNAARELRPSATRILLTGQADEHAIVRALAVAHQFLSKPCSVDVLSDAVERAFALQSLLQVEPVRRLTQDVGALPSASFVHAALAAAIADGTTDVRTLARVVATDPALVVRVLQLARAALESLGREAWSIDNAVATIGAEGLRSLLAAPHGLVDASTRTFAPGFSLERVRECSVSTSRLVRRIVDNEADADVAVTAALVHDVGWLVLGERGEVPFDRILAAAMSGGRQIHDVESELLGTTHAEVGAFVLGSWGLPAEITQIVAFHHRPSALGSDVFGPLGAVHVADALIDCARSGAPPESRLDLAYLERLGLTHRIPGWLDVAREFDTAA